MIILRYLLFPFSLIYGWITTIRNFLFEKNILKSTSFKIPIIVVGNLSVGGTGKTPQIEYLIRLLSPKYKVATLSRGYKRKSTGFILANADATSELIGDEPYQLHQKFPNIHVAVDADRANGIQQLRSQKERPEVILLDDAFQHRKVKAGWYILLSSFDDLYFNDYVLPTGNLRESRKGASRADMIIITKCPKDLSELAQKSIKQKIGLDCPVYFSCISYHDSIINHHDSKLVTDIEKQSKLLITGIAKPQPFFDFMAHENDEKLVFPDHHFFTSADVDLIKRKSASKDLVVTTEKDFVRLNAHWEDAKLYYLPIQSFFIDKKEDFDQKIESYVGESTRNR
jgi:tetraacyldisaccharide 4'-kinase